MVRFSSSRCIETYQGVRNERWARAMLACSRLNIKRKITDITTIFKIINKILKKFNLDTFVDFALLIDYLPLQNLFDELKVG